MKAACIVICGINVADAPHACDISGIPTHQPHIIIYNIVISTQLGFGTYILVQ